MELGTRLAIVDWGFFSSEVDQGQIPFFFPSQFCNFIEMSDRSNMQHLSLMK